MMARTTVSVDDTLLRDAQRVLGTHGVSDTVNAALGVVVRQARLAAFDITSFDVTDDDIGEARADRSESPT